MIPLIGSLSFATGASVFKFDPTDIVRILHMESKSTLDDIRLKKDALNFQLGVHLGSYWKRLFWDVSLFGYGYKTKMFFNCADYMAGADIEQEIKISSYFTFGAQAKVGYRHRVNLPGLYFTCGFSDMLLSQESPTGSGIKHYATPFWGFGVDFLSFKRASIFFEFQHKISPAKKFSDDDLKTLFGAKSDEELAQFKEETRFTEKLNGRAFRIGLSHWRVLAGVQFHLLRARNV